VVLRHLRNKLDASKDFCDRWLLGEDLRAWAAPHMIEELNTLEQVLLAARLVSRATAPRCLRSVATRARRETPRPRSFREASRTRSKFFPKTRRAPPDGK
jgi:hypothetical protein